MVGLANSVFLLLLVAFAEHLPFPIAYAASAAASILLITGYSASVLGRRSRAIGVGMMLCGLYGILYAALNSEDYAMLLGSLAVYATLAALMLLTRKIDWNRQRGPKLAPPFARPLRA